MKIHSISSLDVPELSPYRTLRRPQEHREQGIFIAEGAKVAARLIEGNGPPVVSALLTPAWLERLRAPLEKLADDFPVYVAEQRVLEAIVGFRLHQGIMAIGRVPEPPPFADFLGTLPSPRLLVLLDGLVDPENVGVVVRNAVALGAQAVVSGETSSSPYLRRSVRNSMGTVFRIPVYHAVDLARTIEELRADHSITVIGADPRGSCLLDEADFSGDTALAFGNEGDGLRASVADRCSRLVQIPMRDGVDSLNVSSASAVFLYESRRQRKGKSG